MQQVLGLRARALLPCHLQTAGKTTLLRNLLENSTERIACIVNDVASINIDAKLVRNDRNRGRNSSANTTSDLADTIELQNGCACKFLPAKPRMRTQILGCLSKPSSPLAQAAASRTSSLFLSSRFWLLETSAVSLMPGEDEVGQPEARHRQRKSLTRYLFSAGLCWKTVVWRSHRTCATSSQSLRQAACQSWRGWSWTRW